MRFGLVVILLLTNANVCVRSQLITALNNALDFVNKYYNQINLDGAIGIVLAEAQLLKLQELELDNKTANIVDMLIQKSTVWKRVKHLIPKSLFADYLLNPYFWTKDVDFRFGELYDLGIYKSWTIKDILRNKTAVFAGVYSDECLYDLLKDNTCTVTSRCKFLMFASRIDISYVLSHRLFYLQIMAHLGCRKPLGSSNIIRTYCSLMLKEAKTNQHLGYPQHDIFLEQVLFCGMEGFEEFLTDHYLKTILTWQTSQGCFKDTPKSPKNKLQPRSANIIAFNCTDHATGLGIAAMSINLRLRLNCAFGRSQIDGTNCLQFFNFKLEDIIVVI